MTTERRQVPASESLLNGDITAQWALIHVALLDGATLELKVPGVIGVSWGAYAATPDEPPSIAVTRGARRRRASLTRVFR